MKWQNITSGKMAEAIEISKGVLDIESYLNNRPDLKNYKIFRNSDAHYLENISQRESYIDVEDISQIFK